jgi:hypothetical protein
MSLGLGHRKCLILDVRTCLNEKRHEKREENLEIVGKFKATCIERVKQRKVRQKRKKGEKRSKGWATRKQS